MEIEALDNDFEKENDISFSEDQESFEQVEEEYMGSKNKLDMYLDTEYCDEGALSIQVFCVLNTFQTEFIFSFILIHDKYESNFDKELLKKFKKDNKCYVFFTNIRGKLTTIPILDYFLKIVENMEHINFPDHEIVKIATNVWFYYSLQDLNIAFGIDYMKKLYLSKNNPVNQWRSVSGYFSETINDYKGKYNFNIKLKDIAGISKFGLQNLADSYSIPFKKDSVLDIYKSKMDQAIVDHPERFLKYGLEDAKVQHLIMINAVEGFNKIIKESLKVTSETELFTLDNIPMTLGRLVTQVYQKYLNNVILKGDLSIKASMIKNAVLNKAHNNFLTSLEIQQQIKKLKTLKSLRVKLSIDDKFRLGVEKLLKTEKAFKYMPWQMASCEILTEKSINNELFTSSIVSGGRVHNNRYKEVFMENACDVDIKQAYGQKLRQAIYPIGRPRIYSHTLDSVKELTLKAFMDKYESNLSNKNYKITVTGTLDFTQDLIYSRIISNSAIEKKVSNYDPLDPESYTGDAQHVLLQHEIVNGIITESIWELINKIATNNEKKSFFNLKVNNAVFWLDSDRVETIEELADIFLKDEGKRDFDTSVTTNTDTTTFKWYGAELEGFVLELLLKRAELKKKKVEQALEQTIKLFINTLYGSITSKFFPINNTVVADRITSSIRSECWIMEKCLNFHLSVTDGGITSLNQVLHIDKFKNLPGFGKLSNFYKILEDTPYVIGFLADIDWSTYFKQDIFPSDIKAKLVNLIQDHIDNFMKTYKLKFKIDIEIKNIIQKGSYMGKAHYWLKIFDEKTNILSTEPYFRIRGYRQVSEIEFEHPIYSFLQDIALKGSTDYKNNDFYNNPWIPLNDGFYKVKKLLRLPSWKMSLNKDKISSYGDDIVPGSSIFEEHYFRLGNTHFPIMTAKEHKSKSRRSQRRSVNKEGQTQLVAMFERYLIKFGINKMLNYMFDDKLKKL